MSSSLRSFELPAELSEIHVARLRLAEHPAALLFFLDVMLDHLREDGDARFEMIVARAQRTRFPR